MKAMHVFDERAPYVIDLSISFQISAGDYRRFCPGSSQIWSLETNRQFAKTRHWQAFLQLSGVLSPGAGLTKEFD
jgi:hypothetical protein